MTDEVPGLDRVLSPQGWPLASAPSTGPGDPGRFAALYGRDSLITSLQLMPVRPDVARASLRALAELQGGRDDPRTDEEPGKIPHEVWDQAPERLKAGGWPVTDDGGLRYYGSADSTCWFLVVLAALEEADLAAELEPSWRAAGQWLERVLDRGAGFVRHGPRRAPGGLAQQGWRDAVDPTDPNEHGGGVVRPDGEAPHPPLADADTQAVAVMALRAHARLSGDPSRLMAADELSERIGDAFDPDTAALEADGRRVPGPGSWLGWLLWADALPPELAAGFAERLLREDVRSRWGLRTLSSEHPAFRPDSYHRGSVWPFDCWLGWGGLRAVGAHEEAERVRAGVLEALELLGLWPELYAVTDEGPRAIPVANRIQAWTVGAAWALEHGFEGRITALDGRVQAGGRGGNG
ncbi:MAG: amylo-alpha-1,6-glucosidase [Thermoleophilaceae bacterium]